MKRILRFVRTTLAGGVLFLVPVVVIVVVLQKALALADKLVTPLAARLPFESVVGFRTPVVLAVSMLVLFCLLAGLFARTRLAKRVVGSLETSVLSNVPGYHFFKSIGEDLLHIESARSLPVVMVRLGDAWQLALQIETLENGFIAVFVPGAPRPTSGAILFVPSKLVILTTLPERDALKCMKQMGAGSRPLLRGIELK